MSFQATFRELLTERGLTVDEVARRAESIGGVSPSSVRSYYYGQRRPGMRALRVLATALDVSADRLLCDPVEAA